MKLENSKCIMQFQSKGGEISSWVDKKSNIEYMWQGNSEYWSGKNPTLFPIIGNTYSGTYYINDKEYAMKNHGFIRSSDLSLINQSDNSLTFELKSNDDTFAVYPFEFTYNITYELNDKLLLVKYLIVNEGNCDMPFQFGLHPAFNCPLDNGEDFEAYQLEFSENEMLLQWHIDPDKGKPVQKEAINTKTIPCKYELFEKDPTLLYEGIKSDYITLKGKEHGLVMSLKSFPLLAVWSPKRGAPFICIEPWIGHGDFNKCDDDFYQRDYTTILKAGKSFEREYTIEIF